MLLGTDKFFNFFLFFSKFKFKFVSESVRNHWENSESRQLVTIALLF